MNENPTYKLAIAGHTDNVGNAEKNLELSKGRAAAVKAYLVAKGVAADRMTSDGFGDTQSVADNTTTEGKAKNRRVEFKVEFEDFE
jgi:outer membrane protein OmpA-like peptidoglycan-associated protein